MARPLPQTLFLDAYLTEFAERLIRKNFLPDPLLGVLRRQRRALRNPLSGWRPSWKA